MWYVPGVDTTAREKILADLDRRWTEALISERHRERAKILVLLVHQVMDERSEVPDHYYALIRSKIKSLTDDLHRMSTNEMAVVARAVQIAGSAIPDPTLGVAFKKELTVEEGEEIRIRYPFMHLKPSLNGHSAPASENGNGANGHSDGNGNRTPEPEAPEEEAVADEPPWRWSPCSEPQKIWHHQPRQNYRF
jgi:hypothetical protein